MQGYFSPRGWDEPQQLCPTLPPGLKLSGANRNRSGIRAGAADVEQRVQAELFAAENFRCEKRLRVSGLALANPGVLNVVKDRVTSPMEREVVSSSLTWSTDSRLRSSLAEG